MSRLDLVLALNEEFAEAYIQGERWALQQADMINSLDGKATRRHPERAPLEDGKPRNWCGSCIHLEGCICCDLDNNHEFLKEVGAYHTE